MPWLAAAQFELPIEYVDCTDYAVGWVSESLFYVFFTNDGRLYRIEGTFNGVDHIEFVRTGDSGTDIVVTDLGTVAGSITGLQRQPSGSSPSSPTRLTA
jgi:hypothetical protein